MDMSDDHVLVYSKFTQALMATEDAKIVEVANARPHLIPQMPWTALDLFALKPSFIKALDPKTLEILVQKLLKISKNTKKLFMMPLQIDSEDLAWKLMHQVPRSTLLTVAKNNPEILANLPTDRHYPARPLVEDLIKDKRFLEDIPVEVHAYLAGTNFRKMVKSIRCMLPNFYDILPVCLDRS